MRVAVMGAVLGVLVSACAAGVESAVIREPDGSTGLMVKCRLGSPWRCMEEVNTYCPEGYTPISDDGAPKSPLSPGLFQRGQTWFIHVKCGSAAD